MRYRVLFAGGGDQVIEAEGYTLSIGWLNFYDSAAHEEAGQPVAQYRIDAGAGGVLGIVEFASELSYDPPAGTSVICHGP